MSSKDKGCDRKRRDGGDDCDDREVSFESSATKVEIESRNGTDKLKFEISTEEWYDIKLKYYSTVDSVSEEAKYKIRFRSLIEYVDASNGAPGYQAGEEFQVTDLSQVTWDPIACVQGNQSIDCVVRTNGAYAGVFSSSIHVGGTTFSQDGVLVRPNSAKISVTLNKDRAVGHKLALDVRVVSETERETSDESDEEREGIANDEKQISFGRDAFFTWVEYATVNGVNVNVIASNLAPSNDATDVDGDRKRDGGCRRRRDSGSCNKRDGGDCDCEQKEESSSRVIFSFDVGTPGVIVWDPKIGYAGTSASSIILPSLMLLALLLFFL